MATERGEGDEGPDKVARKPSGEASVGEGEPPRLHRDVAREVAVAPGAREEEDEVVEGGELRAVGVHLRAQRRVKRRERGRALAQWRLGIDVRDRQLLLLSHTRKGLDK